MVKIYEKFQNHVKSPILIGFSKINFFLKIQINFNKLLSFYLEFHMRTLKKIILKISSKIDYRCAKSFLPKMAKN
jgi:hypothetical protein